jgi:MOSC domain-containing protein YiiM
LELSHGAFGENITLSAATEEDFCIGDVLQVGTVIFQVSQPRFPCVKPGRLWNRPRMPHLMEETGFTGFYTRVQHTGVIEAGQSVVLLERPHPGWTIARANRIMHAEDSTLEEREGLRALEPLAPEWKRALSRRLQQREG